MDNKIIGEYIRKYRISKGLSQTQLSEMVNINANTISLYERGEKTPSRDVLFDFARILGFSIDEMIENETFSGTSLSPGEITELMNELTPPQRKAVLVSMKAMVQAFWEENQEK